MFKLIKGSLSDFHLASYLIDEVQIGSVDSVSKLWEDIFTTFPVDSRPIRFEYIARCILTALRQIASMLPLVIRVCRLLIRRELR